MTQASSRTTQRLWHISMFYFLGGRITFPAAPEGLPLHTKQSHGMKMEGRPSGPGWRTPTGQPWGFVPTLDGLLNQPFNRVGLLDVSSAECRGGRDRLRDRALALKVFLNTPLHSMRGTRALGYGQCSVGCRADGGFRGRFESSLNEFSRGGPCPAPIAALPLLPTKGRRPCLTTFSTAS